MTHEESRARRKLMADEIRSGHALGDVARRFDASIALVRSSGYEHGVQMPRRQDAGRARVLPPFVVLKALLDGEDPADIAKCFSVTRQAIYALKRLAKAAGFGFPEMKRGRRKRG